MTYVGHIAKSSKVLFPHPTTRVWKKSRKVVDEFAIPSLCIMIIKWLWLRLAYCQVKLPWDIRVNQSLGMPKTKDILLTSCVESPYYFHRFASKLAEIYVKVNIRPLTMLVDFWWFFNKSFMVGYHLCPVLVSLLSRECWFPQLPQRQCGAFVLITLSFECLLYANYYLKT